MPKKKKVVIGCSGGPDSMALLAKMCEGDCEIIVAHVHYGKRDSATRDTLIVKEFCQSHGLTMTLLMADPNKVSGNFQNWARVIRYQFFKKVYEKNHCEALYLAHQEDDLIETYLMQKEKALVPNYYGIKEHTVIDGMDVYRPFLKYSKAELITYLDNKQIPYGIDESNLANDYRRNQLRHEVVDKLDKAKRVMICEEIQALNIDKSQKEKKTKTFLNGRKKISFKEFEDFKEKEDLLRELLYKDLSKGHVNDLIKSLLEAKKMEVLIRDKYLVKEYDYLEVYDKPLEYVDHYKQIDYLTKKYYQLTSEGLKRQALKLTDDDFPLTIRNFKEGDSIQMTYGKKKVSRFFIDHKIPSKYRKTWPIVLNCHNEVIFVAGIGANVNHYSIKADVFVIELLY